MAKPLLPRCFPNDTQFYGFLWFLWGFYFYGFLWGRTEEWGLGFIFYGLLWGRTEAID